MGFWSEFFGFDSGKEKNKPAGQTYGCYGYGYNNDKHVSSTLRYKANKKLLDEYNQAKNKANKTSKDSEGANVEDKVEHSIIDPRKLDMVKSHTIVGSIENYGTIAKLAALKEWLKANEIDIAKRVLEDDANLSNHKMMLYPAEKGGCFAIGPGCFGNKQLNETTYAIGDTHGDFDTFVSVLDTILSMAKARGNNSPIVYILGDVIDRNGEGCMLETAMIMAILNKSLPDKFAIYNNLRFGIVKGDHDVALDYDASTGRFVAGVKPADYCDWLNARLDAAAGQEELSYIGRAWICLMEECPAAAFLDDSCTLLSHGGIPRSDLQKRLFDGEPYMLQSKEFATDFEWCRMVDAKNKLLNRASKTSEVGFQEFESFNKILCGKIRKFIFGHQHPAKGYQRFNTHYSGYDVVCLSTFRADDIVGGPTIPYFCKIDRDELNVYSMSPAAYVIRLEENSRLVESKPATSTPTTTATSNSAATTTHNPTLIGA